MAGEPLADFEARESDTYREQLENYVELIRELQWTIEAPIKAALYFPAIQHLCVCEQKTRQKPGFRDTPDDASALIRSP